MATTKTQNAVVSPLLSAGDFRQIPLNKLLPSPRNVRQQKRKEHDIAELADSLLHVGQIQNLTVTENTAGLFEVETGETRRLAFLMLLEKKQISAEHPVDCKVIPLAAATTASISENVKRTAMHPADEYLAIQRMRDENIPIEDIAARLGMTPLTVERRLKLANVSPKIMQAFRTEKATLEQLMALAITDDHAAQEAAFFNAPHYQRNPRHIREALMTASVPTTDSVARFVGRKAYEKAGGIINRDLFSEKGREGWMDRALVDALATEKLQKQCEDIKADGFAWVDVAPRFTDADKAGFSNAPEWRRDESTEEKSRSLVIHQRLEAIEELFYGDEEIADDQREKLEAEQAVLEAEAETLEQSLWAINPAFIPLSGAILSVSADGELVVHSGLIRKEDEKAAQALIKSLKAADKGAGKPVPGRPKAPYSEALSRRLTAHLTAGLQISLARQPITALAALLSQWAAPLLLDFDAPDLPLRARLDTSSTLEKDAAGIEADTALTALAELREKWTQRLAEHEDDLMAALQKLPVEDLLELLALCLAHSVDAVNAYGRPEKGHALARLTGLNMQDWWTATAEGYFTHQPKTRILDDMRQFAPAQIEAHANSKKDALATSAEKLAEGTGWLPAILTTPADEAA